MHSTFHQKFFFMHCYKMQIRLGLEKLWVSDIHFNKKLASDFQTLRLLFSSKPRTSINHEIVTIALFFKLRKNLIIGKQISPATGKSTVGVNLFMQEISLLSRLSPNIFQLRSFINNGSKPDITDLPFHSERAGRRAN